jgi:hypothetical protein
VFSIIDAITYALTTIPFMTEQFAAKAHIQTLCLQILISPITLLFYHTVANNTTQTNGKADEITSLFAHYFSNDLFCFLSSRFSLASLSA